MEYKSGMQPHFWTIVYCWNFWNFPALDDTSLFLPVKNQDFMKEDILTTMFYLAVVLFGLPTIHFFMLAESFEKKQKNQALVVYGCAVFLIILIPVLYYGAENTQRAIGSALGDLIMFLFYATAGMGLIILLILLFLGNWGMLLRSLMDKLKKK